MRWLLFVALLILPFALASEVEIGTLTVSNSTVMTLNITNFPYGGATGTVTLRFGAKEWSPTSIWLLPDGFETSQFSYTNYKTVPGSLNLTNDCRTSFYVNATSGKKAYKASVASGSFCILADPGTYRIVAEY